MRFAAAEEQDGRAMKIADNRPLNGKTVNLVTV
jgi:hypothetical protein